MKKETPHSFELRGRADRRFEDSGVSRRKPTTGRSQRQKRSPKERSAAPGTVTICFASSSRPSGVVTRPDGPTATVRLRPARSLRALGLTRPFGGASRPMPSAQVLSNQQ